jgi:hypothetical protein
MDTFLPPFIMFSVQLLVIIGVAALSEALGRVTDARLRLTSRCVSLHCPFPRHSGRAFSAQFPSLRS